jgi:aminopeptidase
VDGRLLERYADLVVGFGANVQPGQMVEIASGLGKEEVTRALAARAWQAGAVFVRVDYADPYLRRARLLHASDDALGFEPRWTVEHARELGERGAATISLSGPVAPGALDGLDPERLRRDRPPAAAEWVRLLNENAINWIVAPCPTPAWAKLVHPDLGERGVDRLWEQIAHTLRLDEPDPVAAWNERVAELERSKERLNALALDAVRLEGPGTDLTVGLLPSSEWHGGGDRTASGVAFHANLPTEEVFTSPDPLRAEGVVTATKPLYLADTMITGLRVRFEGGRAVAIEAERGGEVLRAYSERDPGASRLGEVALVDRGGRVGELDTVFFDTLLDENAASHIALGTGFAWAVGADDRDRVNASEVHVDFMVGGDEVAVTGITRSREDVPLLRGGEWQIGR